MFSVCCLCLGVAGIRNGVIANDSFDKLALPAQTGLGLNRECICSACLYCTREGQGLVGVYQKVQSLVTQYDKHANILKIFRNKQQPGT